MDELQRRQKVIGLAAISGSICFWGLTPVLLRNLTSEVDAWTANGVRYPLAATLYWPVLYHQWKSGRLTRDVWKAALVPAFLTGTGQVFWALAPYYLPASTIGFYIRMSLFWSLLAAGLVFPDERQLILRPRFLLGVAISLVGLFALTDRNGAAVGAGETTGLVIITLCSLFFGLYAVGVRIWMSQFHPLLGFGCVSQLVAAWTLGLMLLNGDTQTLQTISTAAVTQLVVASILGIAVGHFLLYTAVRNIGAALSSAAHTATPFLTAILANIFLTEQLTTMQWSGGVILVLGAILLLSTQFRWTPWRRSVSSGPVETAPPAVPSEPLHRE